MENQEYPNFDLFDKAMKENNQNKQEETKEYYEECDHEYTIKSLGWKICVTCGVCLDQTLCRDIDYELDYNRTFVSNIGRNKVKEIKPKSITRSVITSTPSNH